MSETYQMNAQGDLISNTCNTSNKGKDNGDHTHRTALDRQNYEIIALNSLPDQHQVRRSLLCGYSS
jgi:hypothetical protein